MSIAEGIESGSHNLFHACFNLFGREGVALSEHVFIFTYTIYIFRLAVQIETLVLVVSCLWP